MPAYRYEALTSQGKKKSGVLQADSARLARESLRKQDLFPVSVDPVVDQKQSKSNNTSKKTLFNKKLSLKELSLITRQLATLLEAGVPIDEALGSAAEQNNKPHVRNILAGVRSKIMEGESIAKAMQAFSNSFPSIYRTTVAAGESSGRLDKVLEHLAEYIENQRRIRNKIMQALTYPLLMVLVSFGVVIFLLWKVVPQIISVVLQAHQALPTSTKILLAISNFIMDDGWIVLVVLVLAVIGIKALMRITTFRYAWDAFLLKVPFINKVIIQMNTARFARTFSILIAASVPILDALYSSAGLLNSLPMQKAVQEAAEDVREGASLKRALTASGFFPPMFLHLIGTGEQSGRLGQLLNQAAKELEHDVDNVLQAVLTLFEPLMILLMGGIVLYIVLAVMLPIFNLDQFNG
jgi:general secretion pathway protein F